MKTKFVKQFLTAALAATLAFTSVVPAYAADNTELLNENSEENGNGDNTGDDAGLDASVETPANGDTTDNNNNDTVEQKDDTSANTDNAQNVPGEPADNDDADDQQNTDEQNQPADPEQAQEEENEEEESAPEEEEAAEIVGTAGSVDITFNYYITYDAEDPENQDNLFKSITKTMPLGLDPESRKAQETYVYPIVGTPAYSTFVFEFWADAPDTDLEADYNSVSYDERPNMISLGQYYQYPGSPLDPAQFAEEGKGTINLYAQWKKGDGDVKVVIHAGDNGSYKDPYNYLTTLTVGYPLSWNVDYSSMYCFGVYPNKGYTFSGLYLDEDCEIPFPKTTQQYYDSENYFITDDLLNEDGELHVYLKFEPIIISRITIYGFGNEKRIIEGSFTLDDVFPEDMSVTTPEGGEFHGFWGNSAANHEAEIEVIPGVTKIGDVLYYRSYTSHSDHTYIYDTALITHWRDARTYKVTYHLNLGNTDVKETFDYTVSNRTTSLDLAKGELSQNSAFPQDAGTFLGWKANNGKEFGRAETVGSLITYMRNNKLSSMDIYAQWDKGAYTVEFKAGADWDAEYSFAGSELTDGATETVGLGESYILSGKEFVRKGYTFDHWNVTGGKVATLKATQTFKDIAASGEKVTLTAAWKKQTYTIKLNANGGTLAGGVNTIKYDADTANIASGIALPVVTRTGYDFDGWYEGTTEYTEYGKDLYKNLNLKAKWTVKTYDVVLDAKGGTVKGKDSETIENVAYDKAINLGSYKAANPGYTFTGWKLKDTDTIYKATQKVSKLTTDDTAVLEAQWKGNTYKITYNYDGGSVPKTTPNPVSFVYGTGIAAEDFVTPSKDGYKFTGWTVIRKGAADEELGDKLNAPGAVTLKANWEALSYTIAIYLPDSNVSYSIDYYDYAKSIDFTQHLRAIDKTLDNNIKGLTLDAEGTTASYVTGKSYKISDIVKAGKYTIDPASDEDARTIKLYAVMDSGEKTWYIDYSLVEGVKLSKNNVTSYKTGRAVTLPSASKPGYKFMGWVVQRINDVEVTMEDEDDNLVYYDYPVGSGSIRVITGIKDTAHANYTFAPSFSVNSFSIKVVPNGNDVKKNGEKAVAEVLANKFAYGNNNAEDVLSEYKDSLSRKGYHFVGWGRKAGAKEADAITDFTKLATEGTATVYAIWKADTATITYQNAYALSESMNPVENSEYTAIGDDFHGEVQQVYGKALSLKKLSVPGYTFVGWKQAAGDPDDGLTKKNGYVTAIKKDNTDAHSFYAVFTMNTYSIKLNTQGGTMYNPIGTKNRYFKGTQVIVKDRYYKETVGANEIVSRYDNPTKKGYKFAGIATDAKGKNLIIDAEGYVIPTDDNQYDITAKNRGFAVKNKGTVILYAIWEKVDGVKVTGVKSVYNYKNNTLSVDAVTGIEDIEDVRFEIQYSTGILFTKKSTVTAVITGADSTVLIPRSGSNFYVKVRAGRKDSSGNYVFGKWSSTVRASKVLGE